MRASRAERILGGWGRQAAWVFAVVTLSRVSFGQSNPVVKLDWDGPAQCPSANDVQERIRNIVGSAEVAADRLHASGRIVCSGEKCRLTLNLTSGSASGTRQFESESCEHLAGAAAVALGVLVRVASNAEAVLTTKDLGEPLPAPTSQFEKPKANAAASSAPAVAPLPSGRPESDGAAKGGTSSRPHIDWRLRVPAMGIALMAMPGLTLGYGFGIGAGYSHWEAVFTGYYWPKRDLQSRWPGYGATVTQYSVDLDLCRAWRIGQFEGGPCVRCGLKQVIASGTGEEMVPKTASVAVLTTGVAVLLRGFVTPWAALFFTGAAEVGTTQPTLSNQGFGQIYQFPLLSLKFGLGSEWIF